MLILLLGIKREMIMKIRIGISGTKEYSDRDRIKKYCYKLKQLFEEDLVIVTRGKAYGVEKLAKNMANLFDIEYEEILPMHKKWKTVEYSSKVGFLNSKEYAENLDSLVIFGENLPEALFWVIDNLKKQNKKVVFRQ